MFNRISCILLVTAFSLLFPCVAQASAADGTTMARQGIVRCGGNNITRLSGSEIQITFFVLHNFNRSDPITIDWMRVFRANGTVMFDSRHTGLPLSGNGILGPTKNILGPNQTANFGTNTFLPDLISDPTVRPLQMELKWSSDVPVLTLDVSSHRVTRGVSPAEERARASAACRTIFLK